ncbi:hypothetical protein SEUCBS139899_002459 [Sporothrix eucalyptigena]|uniref:J domain-containing protein n=1 Tax=Sporothrix eucalyptigena TaxID=1812306 RepID=A0ABP0B465_9PEZI
MASGVGGGTVLSGKDHYAMLEVPMSADDATIAASYRRLARLKHPDKNRTNPNATAEFQALQEAYTVLKDETKRFEYNRRILLKKGPTGGAPRARAAAARTANASASAAATMAATAAAVEMLRQKRKQTQQEHSAAASAGVFSFHVSPSWDTPTAKQKESKMPPTTPTAQTTTTPGPDKASGGIPMDSSTLETGPSYPPMPTNKPEWPKEPSKKSHALEKEIRQVRKEIRIDEKAVRRLTRETKKIAGEISSHWGTVHDLNDQVAEVTQKRSKIEEKAMEQEWFDGLFGEQPSIPAAFPMPRPVSHKTAERLKQNERTYETLQKKLAKIYESIEAAMAGSRKIVDEIQQIDDQKAKKETALQELSRQWRVNEFGVQGDIGETAGAWDGWCGWDEGEVDLDTDDKNDDEYNDDTGTAYQGNRGFGHEHASWWYSASDEDTAVHGDGSDTMYADHGSSFAFNPNVEEWAAGASSGHTSTHGLEDIFFSTQVDAKNVHAGANVTNASQSQSFGYYAPPDETHQPFPQYGQYEHYEQYGQYSTPYDKLRQKHKKTASTAAEDAYYDPSNEDESIGGGATLNGYAGKRKQAQQQTEAYADEEDEEPKTVKEEESAENESDPISTGLKADPLQNTATRSMDDNDDDDDDADDADDRGPEKKEEDKEYDDDNSNEKASFWTGQCVTDLLDLGPSAQDESSDLIDMDSVTPPMGMTLPPMLPAHIPYRRGMGSNISTLTRSAAATQAWWPGGEIAAEQNSIHGGDLREQAWRQARWNEW